MDSGLTTAEMLHEKLRRLMNHERNHLADLFRDLAWADNADDIEEIGKTVREILDGHQGRLIRMTLDGPKQEGGEHG